MPKLKKNFVLILFCSGIFSKSFKKALFFL